MLSVHPQAGGGHARARRASAWARGLARACTCCWRPRRSRRCGAAASSRPDDVRFLAGPVLAPPPAAVAGRGAGRGHAGGRAARGGAGRRGPPVIPYRAPVGAARACWRCPWRRRASSRAWAALVLALDVLALLALAASTSSLARRRAAGGAARAARSASVGVGEPGRAAAGRTGRRRHGGGARAGRRARRPSPPSPRRPRCASRRTARRAGCTG